LAGEPNKRLKPPRDVRFGTQGSLSINYEAGQFYDHEAKVGGGVCDLVMHKMGVDHAGAIAWLRQQGFLPSPEPRLKVIRDTGASYDYVDEDGILLSQVIRHEPKDFRQRRPDGREGWIWNLEGVRRVLYHLPDLIAASGNLIFITEVKGLRQRPALGFTATTNMGGAEMAFRV
jgi:putative DNA primase/helicase